MGNVNTGGGGSSSPWDYLAKGAVDFFGGALSGPDKRPAFENRGGEIQLLSPGGKNLLDMLIKSLASGSGEFGFGNAARSGTATLQQMLAGRGISPQSGVATAATGDMLAKAMSLDNQNRFSRMLAASTAAPAIGHGKMGKTWREYDQSNLYGQWGTGDQPRQVRNPLARNKMVDRMLKNMGISEDQLWGDEWV